MARLFSVEEFMMLLARFETVRQHGIEKIQHAYSARLFLAPTHCDLATDCLS